MHIRLTLYMQTRIKSTITAHLSESIDREVIIFLGVPTRTTWLDTHDLAGEMLNLTAVKNQDAK